MVAKKPRIVIIGAGMAGLTAANKLYTCSSSKDMFELCVVEGGNRIGGRINTSEFGGDRIEMGATWIHGIGGSPVYKIAQETNSLCSQQPWECMDGFLDAAYTRAEGGYELSPCLVHSISTLFKNLMDFAQGKLIQPNNDAVDFEFYKNLAIKASNLANLEAKNPSIGSFLRHGLNAYWESQSFKDEEKKKVCGNWSRKLLAEAIFAMHENIQRTYTSAGDLLTLDFNAESEYEMFPGEEITIAKGYLSVIESLASIIPKGLIQLGRKVSRIEWQPAETQEESMVNGYANGAYKPVKLHFCDGSVMCADHVLVTVSLGVLKAGISQDSGMLFSPPLPCFKAEAISRLGFGVVNKLFLQLREENCSKFPLLQMAFHKQDSELRYKKIPWWMRRTASISPIYKNSSVLLSWFAGKEALELEALSDEEIIDGVSTTISSFSQSSDWDQLCNGGIDCDGSSNGNKEIKFSKVLKSKWGNDPLFLGSYSYVAVGSSGHDMDKLAEPLPNFESSDGSSSSSSTSPPLQILFAGEATHRTHYSTTHGAFFSGLREANRLLQHYNCIGF